MGTVLLRGAEIGTVMLRQPVADRAFEASRNLAACSRKAVLLHRRMWPCTMQGLHGCPVFPVFPEFPEIVDVCVWVGSFYHSVLLLHIVMGRGDVLRQKDAIVE